MIIKVLSRSGSMQAASGGLVNYIFKYILDPNKITKDDITPKKLGSIDGKFIIRHNVRARTIQGFIKAFNTNESYRLVNRRDSSRLFHSIISFGPGDRKLITDEMLKDIAHRYIQERSPNSLWVGTKHEDRDHLHIHLCHSGVTVAGKSARVSNQKFHSIKIALDRYQREKYPFLIHSLPDYTKNTEKKQNNSINIERLKANRQTNKTQLVKTLEKIYNKAISKEDFLSQLKSNGLEVYMRAGKLQGIIQDGTTKFRFNPLGFNEDRFEALDKIKDELMPAGVCHTRGHMNLKAKKQEIEPVLRKAGVSKELEELSAIRRNASEKDRELEHSFERETKFIDLENDETMDLIQSDIYMFSSHVVAVE
jgi:hypothetical protein